MASHEIRRPRDNVFSWPVTGVLWPVINHVKAKASTELDCRIGSTDKISNRTENSKIIGTVFSLMISMEYEQ